MSRFEKLFSPIKIKGVFLRNRVVLPAMNTNFAEADGSVIEKFKRSYVERGGPGFSLSLPLTSILLQRKGWELCSFTRTVSFRN
jgi:2,4-dienoyl-CoA reductase-like NADH-dependent reductase (Old Yellow Enzyme family)